MTARSAAVIAIGCRLTRRTLLRNGGRAASRCAKIEKFVWRARLGKMAGAWNLVPIFRATPRLPRRGSRTGRTRRRRNGETMSREDGMAGGVYYSRGDGVKRGVIVNIFAASALSLKTMAVVQLSRFEPTSAPRSSRRTWLRDRPNSVPEHAYACAYALTIAVNSTMDRLIRSRVRFATVANASTMTNYRHRDQTVSLCGAISLFDPEDHAWRNDNVDPCDAQI